ncbi:uncharacterized protein LOC143178216 [Calliopsis andreniformis]|uniref:uncharacterized protein LOC143178216 n=1 Tax=Calliopsis andreniformis TaxID=337506 RepID=UPI003FCCDCCA
MNTNFHPINHIYQTAAIPFTISNKKMLDTIVNPETLSKTLKYSKQPSPPRSRFAAARARAGVRTSSDVATPRTTTSSRSPDFSWKRNATAPADKEGYATNTSCVSALFRSSLFDGIVEFAKVAAEEMREHNLCIGTHANRGGAEVLSRSRTRKVIWSAHGDGNSQDKGAGDKRESRGLVKRVRGRNVFDTFEERHGSEHDGTGLITAPLAYGSIFLRNGIESYDILYWVIKTFDWLQAFHGERLVKLFHGGK